MAQKKDMFNRSHQIEKQKQNTNKEKFQLQRWGRGASSSDKSADNNMSPDV